ncbi:MAG: BlaI/MecI/CopY family transcriptional regulator [Catonella sp.]|uniref:BlaI/MecI/CopY family transcriptional regulator n=2 Tax=Catonella sp. TaxID=2382125 RepID=UPI003F9FAB88
MSELKLHGGELNVMELLWSNKELAAKDISKIIKEYIGWEKNTTYTVIKRLIDKGAVKRTDPGFICSALISQRSVREIETKRFLEQFYNGSLQTFITEFLMNQELSENNITELKEIVAKKSGKN